MARALSHFHGKSSFPSLSKLNPYPPPSSSSSYSRKAMVSTAAHNQSYWASIEAEVEAQLKKAIPVRPPVEVFEPMQSLVLAAPKTKAPAICIAACELVGGCQDEAMTAASALHLVHAAAYIHEQLPLTTRPTLNPNIGPKAHHAFKPNIELLTPDGILPFSFELLARSVDPARNNSDRVLRVIVEISHAVGTQGVIGSQYREIEISESNGCDDEWIELVCKKKEGELHACGAACGAILGGGSEEEIKKLRKYGLYAGMIQGLVNTSMGRHKKEFVEKVNQLRELAMEELEFFKGRNVEPIASLAGASLVNV